MNKNARVFDALARVKAASHPSMADAVLELQSAINEALNAQAGWLEQHARDSAELRRLCEARDQYKNEVTRLKACLTEAVDNVVSLRAELQNIADAKPNTWDAEVRDQFREWAQSRARAALAAIKGEGP